LRKLVDIGFEFKVIHRDVHLAKVHVSAWNGIFGGAADIYIGLDKLEEVAKKLQGFPSLLSDTREVILGAPGPGWAGGSVSIRFYCLDRSGRVSVEAKIVSSYDSSGPTQTVTMTLSIEPAAIDSFVDELRRLSGAGMTVARLKAVVPTTD
jgi:hypothetical protein